jgi:hypothetical protein
MPAVWGAVFYLATQPVEAGLQGVVSAPQVALQMACAARHLTVPWGPNGASESQLDR